MRPRAARSSVSAVRLGAVAPVLQRQLALAGVALLAALGALGVPRALDDAGPSLPRSVPAPGGGWYSALAAPTARSAGRTSACGHSLTARSVGLAHPVLPCDIKIFVRVGDRTVLTQIVDRGPYVPGREFELTRELARLLGVRGTQSIRWRFAG